MCPKRTDWPRGSVEQLIGDYYGSCMDETRINKLGIAPAKPMLAEIDAMKTPADLQRMIRRLHDLSVFVPFALDSSSRQSQSHAGDCHVFPPAASACLIAITI